MDFEDFFSIFEGGEIDRHLAIESTRPQECLIEDIGTIGRCHDDHIGIVIESVHLCENLIERLFAFIVTASDTRGSLLSDGIDLIDEYDRRCTLTSILEEITDTCSTDSDEHLNEL